MTTQKYQRIALSIVAAAACTLPGLAFAQTVSDSASSSPTDIQSLLAQIHTLEEQLAQITHGMANGEGMMGNSSMGTSSAAVGLGGYLAPGMHIASSSDQHEGSSTGMMGDGHHMCLGLTRNLTLGSRGSDVTELQKTLSQDPTVYPLGSVTGYYGPATAQAIGRIQMENHLATSSASQGTVGPLTRALFSYWCRPHVGGPDDNAGTSTGTSTIMWMHPPVGPWGSTTPSWMGSTTANLDHMMPMVGGRDQQH